MVVETFKRLRVLKCIPVLSRFGRKVFTDRGRECSILINRRNSHASTIKQPWNVLFFGSDEFALASLKELNEQYKLQKLVCRLEVVTAYKGNENCLTKYAKENEIVIHQWPVQANMEFHIGVVVSFGHLIPSNIINSFPLGMINVHASLLPRWRGSAPIVHTLMKGDTKTGISIMKIMPKKFDVGEVIAQEETSVDSNETQPELYRKLSGMGSKLLIKTMEKLPEILSTGVCQKEDGATYAPKIKPDISFIRWKEMKAKNVYDLNRALTGLYPLKTTFNGQIIKLSNIQVLSDPSNITIFGNSEPGTASYHKENDSLIVRCKGYTWVSIKTIGVPGKPKMSAINFVNGYLGGKKQTFCLFTS